MDTERNPFKNITAETSLDWARDGEQSRTTEVAEQ